MLEDYNFEIDRLKGVHAVMLLVPTFLPDDLNAAAVQAIVTASETLRDNTYLQKLAEQTAATAAFNGAVEALHDACVSVSAAMRSRYRSDPVSMESIARIPVQDRTIGETRQRATILVKVWKLLPLPPNAPVQPGPLPHYYIPFDGMNVAAFEALQAAMATTEAESKTADAAWEKAEGQLHQQERLVHDLNVAASAQGRAQFPDMNTVERELIESIPEEPPVTAPGTAVITQAESPEAGAARLKVTCPRASRYDWETQTGGGPWEPLIADVPLSVLISTGLPAGNMSFRVKGKNSRGDSEWSEPAEITIF